VWRTDTQILGIYPVLVHKKIHTKVWMYC